MKSSGLHFSSLYFLSGKEIKVTKGGSRQLGRDGQRPPTEQLRDDLLVKKKPTPGSLGGSVG